MCQQLVSLYVPAALDSNFTASKTLAPSKYVLTDYDGVISSDHLNVA